GTGKTTVLQSLVGFEMVLMKIVEGRKSWHPRLYNSLLLQDEQGFLRDRGRQAIWEVKVVFSRTLTTQPNGGRDYRLEWSSLGEHSYDSPGDNAAVHPPRCCAYGAGRRMGSASLSEPEPDDPTATLLSDKADLRNPEEWLLRLDYAAAKPSDVQDQQRKRLAQVKELLLSVLPDVEDIRLTISRGLS